MSTTLETLKRLQKLGLPAKWIIPVLEAVEGEPEAAPTKKKRRKRRTPEQMAAAKKKAAKK